MQHQESSTIDKQLAEIQNHMVNTNLSIADFKVQYISAKKNIYRKGDPITSIYFLLEGEVSLKMFGKSFYFNDRTILGDYEAENSIIRRISTLKTITNVKIALIPYSYYFNLNIDVHLTILHSFNFKDNFLRYLVKKYSIKQFIKFNQVFQIKEGIAIIIEGVFKVTKDVSVGYVEQTLTGTGRIYSVIKRCQIASLGCRQVVRENITCWSSIGKLYYLNKSKCKILMDSFQQFKNLLNFNQERLIFHLGRTKSIQKVYKQSKAIRQSLIPISKHVKRIETDVQIKKVKKFPTLRGVEARLSLNKKSSRYKSQESQIYKQSQDWKIIPYYWQKYMSRQKSLKDSIKIKKLTPTNNNQQNASSILPIPSNYIRSKFKMKMFFKSKNLYQAGFKNKNIQQLLQNNKEKISLEIQQS